MFYVYPWWHLAFLPLSYFGESPSACLWLWMMFENMLYNDVVEKIDNFHLPSHFSIERQGFWNLILNVLKYIA